MSLPENIVAAQLQGLLEHLELDKRGRCAAEAANGRERAQAIVRAALAESRNRMRETVRYERARLADELVLKRAESDAAQRRKQHALLRALVTHAHEALPAVLERRWREPAARREWCETTLNTAAQRLRGGDWAIDIASGTSADERERLLARARRLRSGTHTLSVRGDLAAGLSVRSGGATLDATVTGLLDDFGAIGARFLHEWLSNSRTEAPRA